MPAHTHHNWHVPCLSVFKTCNTMHLFCICTMPALVNCMYLESSRGLHQCQGCGPGSQQHLPEMWIYAMLFNVIEHQSFAWNVDLCNVLNTWKCASFAQSLYPKHVIHVLAKWCSRTVADHVLLKWYDMHDWYVHCIAGCQRPWIFQFFLSKHVLTQISMAVLHEIYAKGLSLGARANSRV